MTTVLRFYASAALSVLILIVSSFILSPCQAAGLEIHVIDVWQGDSILVKTPSGATMLVDAAESDQGDRIVSYLKKHGVKQLDCAVVTHPHSDHLGGFLKVLAKIPVKLVYDSTDYSTQTYKAFLKLLKDKGIPKQSLVRGDSIDIDPAVKIKVLSPMKQEIFKFGDLSGLPPDKVRSILNNRSIVLRATYSRSSVLLTGDAEIEAEQEIISSGFTPRADLLKAGHHGSSTSSSRDFLNRTKPKTVAISVGKGNQFGHPHAATVARFEKLKAEILRTDWEGNLVFSSDGTTWTRSSEKQAGLDSLNRVSTVLNRGTLDAAGALETDVDTGAMAEEIATDLEMGMRNSLESLFAEISAAPYGVNPVVRSLAEGVSVKLRIMLLSGDTRYAKDLEVLEKLMDQTGN